MAAQFLVTLRVNADKLAELVIDFPDAVESVTQASEEKRLPIRRRKLTADDKKRIQTLTAGGKSHEEVAREIGCSTVTVSRHAHPSKVAAIPRSGK